MRDELFVRYTDGTEIPIGEMYRFTAHDILVIKVRSYLHPDDIRHMEKDIVERIGGGIRVGIFDASTEKIMCLEEEEVI